MRRPAMLLLLLLTAPLARAQNTKLTSGGAAVLSGAPTGVITSQSATDSTLTTTISFGEVGPANLNAYACFTQPLYLRASVPSSLRLAVTASSFGASSGALKASDIGIGFRNLAPGGPNADLSTTSIVAGFATDPCAAPKNMDGIPAYTATLASLGSALPGTVILQSTGAISPRGSLNSNSNKVLLDLRLAIAPQAFTVGPFSVTITLTLTNP